jgi:chemotaxis protein CheZ
VVSKVVALAIDLEDSLVKLLVQAAPHEPVAESPAGGLNGPVIDAEARSDVVTSQGEVDDLLASLGF